MPVKKPQVFVIQPFRQESEAVFDLISSAAAKAGVSAFRADSITAETTLLGVVNAIQMSPLLIADITHANPNVMYEVGFAQAQNKPLILISASGRSIP